MQADAGAASENWLSAVRLNAEDPLPLYEQLAQSVRSAVEAGSLPAGAVLPPEPLLAERLGVSRQTVHQALSGLARRGLLTRRRGVGTFVAEPAIEQPLSGLYSFLRTLTAQGHLPGTRLLGARLTVDASASTLLAGSPDALVFEISRLRLVDGAPFVVESIYLPAECQGCLSPADLAETTVYDQLAARCGIVVTAADETLRPVRLEQPEAALLGLPVGETAFLVERNGLAGERIVERRVSLIRGDRYRFRVHLAGPTLEGGRS
jgi:GntR family transcriptional regulator